MHRIELTVGMSEDKSRLEDFLCGRFGALSKMYLREVVKTGGCEVNGRQENIGHRLRPNDFIEIKVDLRPRTFDAAASHLTQHHF